MVLAAAALLVGCGGSGEVEQVSSASSGTSQVPASAMQSPEGLAAFLKTLHTTGTDSTSAPLALGEAALPTSDTAQPVAVN